MKPKLFLNSTDVADLTGYSQRNARNIMGFIRAQLNLSKAQAISIYDFSIVFNIPQDILFQYINSKDFKTLPVSRVDLIQLDPKDLKPLSSHVNFCDSDEFEGIINKPRTAKIDPKEVK